MKNKNFRTEPELSHKKINRVKEWDLRQNGKYSGDTTLCCYLDIGNGAQAGTVRCEGIPRIS